MTESVMALPHGSGVREADSPRASARAKVKRSVTARDRSRTSDGSRLRRITRVVYLDAADSWIVSESTPSIRTLWATTYADRTPAGAGPIRVWCQAYRAVAVGVAVPLHTLLWLLTHPLRGPLTVATAALLVLLHHQ